MALPSNPNLVEKETRFAVVMYGGISLAIYIHGAAQELYHMTRATARQADKPDDYLHPDDSLTGAEKIYRLLGKALKTKFVVDILSGTSAGGLNAVFLAKALARGKKMEFVKNFWVKEGDIAALLNDAQSLRGLSGLSLQTPSPALLNSQRFYYKLLEALMRYEERANEDSDSPLVQELDLNITATDIRGLSLPLFITNNNKIVEPRYKNVFQFYYRPQTDYADSRNDFTQENDPFLAFAARCTASIPPAFEAMQLQDIEPILKTAAFNKPYGHLKADAEVWRKFYRDYVNEGDDFAVRSFGDGGYLDNKPFSYATESLLRRRADLPVDRKLIYIEPSPVHAEDKPYPSEKPDMIENISAALFSLPREETIREDLKTLRERNRIVGEINNILENVFSFQIVPPRAGEDADHQWRHSLEWARKFPMDQDVQDWYRSGYYAYHQLRVERVVDNLARAFSRGLGWVEEGEQEARVKRALRTWLGELYGIASEDGKYSQNDVLFRLDMSFRLRRFHFLQTLLNAFIRGLDAAPSEKRSYVESILRNAGLEAQALALDETDALLGRWLLVDLKKSVNNSHANARARAMEMRAWNLAHLEKPSPDLMEYAGHLKTLEKLMGETDEDGLRGSELTQTIEKTTLALGTHPFLSPEKTAPKNLAPSGYLYKSFKSLSDDALTLGIRFDRKDGLDTLNYISDETFAEKLNDARKSYGLTDEAPDASAQSGRLQSFYRQAQQCLAYYHDNFEFYDMLTFPILYGTDAGESDIVEVVRISPEDGTRLVNEARSGRRKLAGTQLMNFGAFFKQEWRENDMLWGRLDTAEILITEMLRGADEEAVKTFEDSVIALYGKNPGEDPAARRAIVYDMAFLEILQEDLGVSDRSLLYQLLNSQEEDIPTSPPPATRRDENLTLAEAAMQLSKSPGGIRKMFDPLVKLAKNINRQGALEKIETQVRKILRAELGAGPSPLRRQFMDALDAERRRLRSERREIERTHRLEKDREKKFDKAESDGRKNLLGWLKPGALGNDAGRIWGRLKNTNRLAFSRIVRAENRERILEYFRLGYETDPNFEPKPTAQAANRSILVLGDMLKGLSDKYPLGKKPAGFLLTVGRVLTAAINFAAPKSLGELAFNSYWVWLAYILAGVLLWAANTIGGASTSDPADAKAVAEAVRRFAFQIFAITAGFHTLVALINNWITRNPIKVMYLYGAEVVLGLIGWALHLPVAINLALLLFGVTLTLHLPARLISATQETWLGGGLKAIAFIFGWVMRLAGLVLLGLFFYGGLVNLGVIPTVERVEWIVGLIRGFFLP